MKLDYIKGRLNLASSIFYEGRGKWKNHEKVIFKNILSIVKSHY